VKEQEVQVKGDKNVAWKVNSKLTFAPEGTASKTV
jgi:hypothetical protein